MFMRSKASKACTASNNVNPTDKDGKGDNVGYEFKPAMVSSRQDVPAVRAMLNSKPDSSSAGKSNKGKGKGKVNGFLLIEEQQVKPNGKTVHVLHPVLIAEVIKNPAHYNLFEVTICGLVVAVTELGDAAKQSARSPPCTAYIANSSGSIHCIMFNKACMPEVFQVGKWVLIEWYKVQQGHSSLGTNHNDYLSVHDKELNVTEAIVTVDKEPQMKYLPPSVARCWPQYTRGNFILTVVEVGILKQVYAGSECVLLLETFCMDSNDMHLKVVFWGEFATAIEESRDEILPPLHDNPNQQYYLVLDWAQAVVQQRELQLHVMSSNVTNPLFPLIEHVNSTFVLFLADDYPALTSGLG